MQKENDEQEFQITRIIRKEKYNFVRVYSTKEVFFSTIDDSDTLSDDYIKISSEKGLLYVKKSALENIGYQLSKIFKLKKDQKLEPIEEINSSIDSDKIKFLARAISILHEIFISFSRFSKTYIDSDFNQILVNSLYELYKDDTDNTEEYFLYFLDILEEYEKGELQLKNDKKDLTIDRQKIISSMSDRIVKNTRFYIQINSAVFILCPSILAFFVWLSVISGKEAGFMLIAPELVVSFLIFLTVYKDFKFIKFRKRGIKFFEGLLIDDLGNELIRED